MRIEVVNHEDGLMKEVFSIREAVFTNEQGISQSLDLDGKDEQAIHILAFDKNTAIGVGRLLIEKTTGILSRIAVVKDYRGKGIAKVIIRELEEIAISGGVNILELYPHSRLRQFYESLGYTIDQNYKGNVSGNELLRMYKKKAAL